MHLQARFKMRVRLEVEEKKLDTLLENISKVVDDEIKAHLSKYFCIKVAGYLENVLKSLIANYTDGTCPRPLNAFVNNNVKSITNLSEEKLCLFLKKFDDSWETNFINKVSKRELESLNSIISNRNSIAHGQQDNISYSYVKQYYEDVKGIVTILKDTVKK